MTSETDIAKPAVVLLESMGFDVYQEVPYGSRADIVAIKNRIVCVVEVKKSLSFEVIAQARHWVRHCLAHWVFVAVPKAKASDGRTLAYSLCEQLGIGVIEVGAHKTWIRSYPKLSKRVSTRLKDAVRPEHKTFAMAGSKGSFWSPWRESVERLRKDVEREPGRLIIDVLKCITHHWANDRSAMSCVSTQIANGIIKGIRIEKGRLYASEP